MSKSITQDMAYRQSLMKYAAKYGVSRASRKYNKSRSYIYFWKQRWDGSVESLRCESRRPHSHPNQHTQAELKLIHDMRHRNPKLGMIELWHRLRKRGYTRCPESLFRTMRKLGLFPAKKPKNKYKSKPYEQMTYPGQRVQVDVKVVPRKCIANPDLRLFQYTAINEFTRLRFLAAYEEQSTYSSADFLRKLTAWYKRHGITVECVQTDNGFEFTNRFSPSKRDLLTLFEKTAAELHMSNAATVKTRNGCMTHTLSILFKILLRSLHGIIAVLTICLCALCVGYLLQSSLSNMFDKPT